MQRLNLPPLPEVHTEQVKILISQMGVADVTGVVFDGVNGQIGVSTCFGCWRGLRMHVE